jgi:hypothetical protein
MLTWQWWRSPTIHVLGPDYVVHSDKRGFVVFVWMCRTTAKSKPRWNLSCPAANGAFVFHIVGSATWLRALECWFTVSQTVYQPIEVLFLSAMGNPKTVSEPPLLPVRSSSSWSTSFVRVDFWRPCPSHQQRGQFTAEWEKLMMGDHGRATPPASNTRAHVAHLHGFSC